jgi:hypothetical protein
MENVLTPRKDDEDTYNRHRSCLHHLSCVDGLRQIIVVILTKEGELS